MMPQSRLNATSIPCPKITVPFCEHILQVHQVTVLTVNRRQESRSNR